MRCKRCGGPAVVVLRRHNAAFCKDCFPVVFTEQVRKAIPLFAQEDRAELYPCESCDQQTTGRFCAFCRAKAQILGRRLEAAEPVEELDDREVAEALADEVLPAEIFGGAAT